MWIAPPVFAARRAANRSATPASLVSSITTRYVRISVNSGPGGRNLHRECLLFNPGLDQPRQTVKYRAPPCRIRRRQQNAMAIKIQMPDIPPTLAAGTLHKRSERRLVGKAYIRAGKYQ